MLLVGGEWRGADVAEENESELEGGGGLRVSARGGGLRVSARGGGGGLVRVRKGRLKGG